MKKGLELQGGALIYGKLACDPDIDLYPRGEGIVRSWPKCRYSAPAVDGD